MMYSLPAGSFDEKRHGDYAGCARAELSEEVSSPSCTKQATALPALGDGLKAFIACSHTLLMASRQALLEAGHFAYPLHKIKLTTALPDTNCFQCTVGLALCNSC